MLHTQSDLVIEIMLSVHQQLKFTDEEVGSEWLSLRLQVTQLLFLVVWVPQEANSTAEIGVRPVRLCSGDPRLEGSSVASRVGQGED